MPVDMEARELVRRKLRYRLYRIQAGDPLEDDGLKGHFESQPEFDGWHNFGVTWDTGDEGEWPEGHFVAVPLKESLEAKWQKTLLGLVEDFPVDDDDPDDTEESEDESDDESEETPEEPDEGSADSSEDEE